MKIEKRTFVLMEIFISIALLSLCAFPLIGSSLRSYQYQKNQLFKLECERQAELYFYQVIKKITTTLDFDHISSRSSLWLSFEELKLSLGGTEKTYYPHYHLYYSSNSKSKTHKKISCRICFPQKKNYCPSKKKNRNKQELYKFIFLVKKIAENSSDPHDAI